MASRIRARTQTAVAVLSAVLFVATLAWPDWIELLFGVDPDHGDGSLEWAILAVTGVGALLLGVRARAAWRQVRVATATGTPR